MQRKGIDFRGAERCHAPRWGRRRGSATDSTSTSATDRLRPPECARAGTSPQPPKCASTQAGEAAAGRGGLGDEYGARVSGLACTDCGLRRWVKPAAGTLLSRLLLTHPTLCRPGVQYLKQYCPALTHGVNCRRACTATHTVHLIHGEQRAGSREQYSTVLYGVIVSE